MEESIPSASLEKLQVQGLECYARVGRDGACHAHFGEVDEDAAAAWPLMVQQANRLGSAFGLDAVSTTRAFFDNRQLYLQSGPNGVEGLIAMKKANTTKILNALTDLG